MHDLNIDYVLERNGKTPEYGTNHAAGADLFLNLKDYGTIPQWSAYGPNVLPAGEHIKLSVGVGFSIPAGYYGKIFDRSGLASKNGVVTGGGVIDSDFTGILQVIIFNHGSDYIYLKHHMKIAQIVFHQYHRGEFKLVEKLPETIRGDKGFGSTGI